MNKKIPIAKIGKRYGIKGWQKIHILSDFPEQFKEGAVFKSDGIDLTIEKIDLKRNLVKFKGINSPEEAKKITNRMLYTTQEETRKNISLEENEYFWFDIIGCEVFEDGKKLGKVIDIERMDTDYLVIKRESKPKRFLIEFKRHVKEVDIKNKKIIAQGAIDILESLK